MERRKFLFGVGGAAVGTSALVGSGAFSYVRADRDITIAVVNDQNAYLGLEATSEYADEINDQLVLDFAGGQGSMSQNGDGLNDDADTRFDNVFRITNQGTNDVRVSFHAGSGVGGMPDSVTWYYQKAGQNKQFTSDRQLHDTSGINLPVLGPGDYLDVHVIFNLRDHDASTLSGFDTLGIVAEE